MMQLPLLDLHFDIFINLEAQDIVHDFSFLRTDISLMVPNQDYRKDGEESASAMCSRGSSLYCSALCLSVSSFL
jgi:hypothetical protein